MALIRVWTPSPNRSSGGTKRLIVVHTMEGFTGPNGAYDCAKYFQGKVGASSQVCIDNNRGKIWECVNRAEGSWTQCNFNSVSVSAEQSGFASWSRDYWLKNRENELRNTAEWIAEEAKKFNIPLRILTPSEAQNGGRGICQHMNLGSSGCAHSDCGPSYPIDKVVEWAKGGGTSSPQPSGDFMSSSAFDSAGNAHFACIWTDGKLNYKPPNGGWYAVDPSATVKSGGDISISSSDLIMLTATNNSGKVITYQKRVTEDKSKWLWTNRDGNAK
jgi:hypothetical protein